MKLPEQQKNETKIDFKEMAKKIKSDKIKKNGFDIHELAMDLYSRKKALEENEESGEE